MQHELVEKIGGEKNHRQAMQALYKMIAIDESENASQHTGESMMEYVCANVSEKNEISVQNVFDAVAILCSMSQKKDFAGRRMLNTMTVMLRQYVKFWTHYRTFGNGLYNILATIYNVVKKKCEPISSEVESLLYVVMDSTTNNEIIVSVMDILNVMFFCNNDVNLSRAVYIAPTLLHKSELAVVKAACKMLTLCSEPPSPAAKKRKLNSVVYNETVYAAMRTAQTHECLVRCMAWHKDEPVIWMLSVINFMLYAGDENGTAFIAAGLIDTLHTLLQHHTNEPMKTHDEEIIAQTCRVLNNVMCCDHVVATCINTKTVDGWLEILAGPYKYTTKVEAFFALKTYIQDTEYIVQCDSLFCFADDFIDQSRPNVVLADTLDLSLDSLLKMIAYLYIRCEKHEAVRQHAEKWACLEPASPAQRMLRRAGLFFTQKNACDGQQCCIVMLGP